MNKFDELRTVWHYLQGLNRGVNSRFHVVHTPPGSTIGGFSCVLVGLSEREVQIEHANGDQEWVPIEEIDFRRP